MGVKRLPRIDRTKLEHKTRQHYLLVYTTFDSTKTAVMEYSQFSTEYLLLLAKPLLIAGMYFNKYCTNTVETATVVVAEKYAHTAGKYRQGSFQALAMKKGPSCINNSYHPTAPVSVTGGAFSRMVHNSSSTSARDLQLPHLLQ